VNWHDRAKNFQLRNVGAFDHTGSRLRCKESSLSEKYIFKSHGLSAILKWILAWPEGQFGALYPIHVRGQAYLAAHEGARAAMEFQKILDHRGIVASDPVGAVARLELGRAFALSGEKAKAAAAYHDFLTLWKDADSDIPILKQANSEYSRIRGDTSLEHR